MLSKMAAANNAFKQLRQPGETPGGRPVYKNRITTGELMQQRRKMKTLLIGAALAGATVATTVPAMAQTNVTVTGLVDVYAGTMRSAGDARSRSVVNSGGMTTSWFGFKGSEDLGGGLKANFLLTSFIQADT